MRVHAPEWIESGHATVTCSVNGKPRPIRWAGRYLELGSAEPGDILALKFPIAERTVKDEKIGQGKFTFVLKGNTVVFVDPPGKYCPLFQREHYRENQVRWRKVERFIPDKAINW